MSDRGIRARSEALLGRGLGALLRLDERLVNRFDPPRPGAIETAAIPWSAEIEARWSSIRAELDLLLDAGIELPDTDDLVGSDQGTEGRWTSYILYWYGTRLDRNAERFPVTTSVIRGVPGLQIAGFTVLHPHSHLPRHQGPAKSLRYQLGIRVPVDPGACRLQVGDEVIVWKEGASLAFDDRSFHEAWNDSDEARYVLFVQTAWPLGGVPGRLHRLMSRAFGSATRHIPQRALEWDTRLNPGRD